MAKEATFTFLALMAVSICLTSTTTTADIVTTPTPPETPLPAPLSNTAREFLEAHNQARAAVGVTPLKWSENLSNATSRLVRYQRNKRSCQFANLNNAKYGGNQMWASGTSVTPRMAVDNWVKEKEFYNHGNDSCATNHECGVYTQVVWRNSLELGCAQATCKEKQTVLTICFYNPPGNVIGEKPY